MLTDRSWLEFAQSMAWPAIALVALLILGPGGLLERLFKILSEGIGGLNKAVKDFKDTTLNMKEDLNGFREIGRSLSDDFSRKIAQIQGQLKSTSEQLDELHQKADKTLSSNTALLKEVVAEKEDDLDPSFADVAPPQEAQKSAAQSTDQRYEAIRGAWESLVEAIRSALGDPEDFDGRRVREMADKLVDRRRKAPIGQEVADKIAALHSQFKRFVRLQSTKDQWLTAELADSFIRRVADALKQVPSQA